MRLIEFRGWIIDQVRAFDKWAWQDARDNPNEWKETMTDEDWMTMFQDFLGDGKRD